MSTTRPTPRDDGALYAEHHRQLRDDVRRSINASPELIEDACQNAWVILLRSEPRLETLYPWLRTVAHHEALRLIREQRRAWPTPDETLCAMAEIGTRATLELQIDAREALVTIASIPHRQGRILAGQIAGLSYEELACRERATPRTIDRQLRRARASIARNVSGRAGDQGRNSSIA